MTTKRLETGRFTPEGDWPGVFIRGDAALIYQRVINNALQMLEASTSLPDNEIAFAWGVDRAQLQDIADLLGSCRQDETPPSAAKARQRFYQNKTKHESTD